MSKPTTFIHIVRWNSFSATYSTTTIHKAHAHKLANANCQKMTTPLFKSRNLPPEVAQYQTNADPTAQGYSHSVKPALPRSSAVHQAASTALQTNRRLHYRSSGPEHSYTFSNLDRLRCSIQNPNPNQINKKQK